MEQLTWIVGIANAVLLTVLIYFVWQGMSMLRRRTAESDTGALTERLDVVAEEVRAVRQATTALPEAVAPLIEALHGARDELAKWSTQQSTLLSDVNERIDASLEKSAGMIEAAGQRVAELEKLETRHGEALRAAAAASLEELLEACGSIASELREIRDRQTEAMTRQESTAEVLARLSTSLDGYVELLKEVA